MVTMFRAKKDSVDCGLSIADCGLIVVDSIRNPQSAIRNGCVAVFCLGIGMGVAGCSEKAVDISIADVKEVDLVEAILTHRAQYHRQLRQLHNYYREHGYTTKQEWAAFELKGLRRVKRFRYLLDAEIPSDTLRPVDQIEEADALYEKGLELMRRGGHGVPVVRRQDRMIEAAEVFRELIERFPSSDKIDDAAFFCGEIHKEYLPGQEQIAVRWYERAWTWNPDTPHPARFQAAVVYDYRLLDRDHALELYQKVVKQETATKADVRFAARRIRELSNAAQTAGATK